MPASPTNTAVQVLILNTAFAVSGEAGPLLATLDTFDPASPWRRVSGDTAPLKIILVDGGGTVVGTPRRVILASGNTLHLSAKVDPADNDQALALDFTQAGADGAEYYEADPGTLAVSDSVFNGNPSANLSVDLIEKNSGGDVLRQWRTTLCLLWSTASGGVSSPITFVSYSVQSPTAPQQTQARANIGAASSASVADVLRYSVQSLTGAEQVIGRRNTSSGAASLHGSTAVPFVRQSVTATVPTTQGSATSGTFDASGLVVGMEVDEGVFETGTTILSIAGTAPSNTVTFSTNATLTETSEIVATALVPIGFGDVVSDGTITSANAGKIPVIDSIMKQIKAGPEYGVVTPFSLMTHDGTVISANAGKIVEVSGDGDGNAMAGPVYATAATASTLVIRDGTGGVTAVGGTFTGVVFSRESVWHGFGEPGSGQGVLVSTNGAFFYGEGGTLLASISAEGGLASFQSVSIVANSITVNGKTLTAPAASGTLATLAGTETLTNKTLTAPVLGTPASGNLANCDAATTTAKGVVELGTSTETLASSSSSLVVTPEGLRSNRVSGFYRHSWSAASWVQGVSGAGAATASTEWGQELTGPLLLAGHAIRYVTPSNQVPISRGVNRGVVDWSKLIEFSGMICTANTPDANTVVRVTWGKASADAAGDLARAGIGFRFASNGVIQAHAHNGTTATTGSNGTFTPVANQGFDYKVSLSSGSGTVTVTINDAVVATCTGGPTAAGGQAAALIQAEVQNTSTVSVQTTIGHSLAATFIGR